MSERYYVNSPLVEQVVLQGPEAHHLAVVCRLRPGNRVCLFNGDGREYLAEITAADKRRVELTIVRSSETSRELPFCLWAASPLPKGDRGQFLIEKLTELGVTDFTPLRTSRSVVHPSDTRVEKLERYVIEASKQCGRNVLMRIHSLQPWPEFLGRSDLPLRRWLADPAGEPCSALKPAGDAVATVGPEGGLSVEEVQAARREGWRLVSLGPRILRVETAGVALASILSSSACSPSPG